MLRRGRLRPPRVRQLWAADRDEVEACLAQSPLENVFLRSEVRRGALRDGALLGVQRSGERRVRAVALRGPLLVPWAPQAADLSALAEALRPTLHRVQLIVGPKDQVERLQRLCEGDLRPVRLLRGEQPHYSLTAGQLRPVAGPRAPLRLARIQDLERVAQAGAAMHREEMGFDPLELDPVGWRERVVTAIRRGWVHLWEEDGRIVFKAECSAVTPEAVQIQGVWTDPELRGQGRATAGMAEVCRQLLASTGAVTLFVNDFNLPAIRVYEKVGFTRIGTMRSVLF
ncbi:MAG: GNAT family N-acetyltransferase [Candidatus Dormibacteria bacterium]